MEPPHQRGPGYSTDGPPLAHFQHPESSVRSLGSRNKGVSCISLASNLGWSLLIDGDLAIVQMDHLAHFWHPESAGKSLGLKNKRCVLYPTFLNSQHCSQIWHLAPLMTPKTHHSLRSLQAMWMRMSEISNPNWDLLDQLAMGANQRVQVPWEALEIKEFLSKDSPN